MKKSTGSLLFDRTADSWKKMKSAFDGFDKLYVIGVSEWITERARKSGMFSGAKCVKCIPNGIDLSNFDYLPHCEKDKKVAEKYGINRSKKVVLHVTPSLRSPFKGGKYYLELAAQMDDDYQCVIVGTNETVDTNKVVCIPFTTNQKELASLYRLADVFVITSTADTYPTVCLEAQACGTPVVGFDVGGVAETIKIGNTVVVGDIDRLKEEVIYWAAQKKNISKNDIMSCVERFNRGRMTDDYVELYHHIKR